MGMPIRLQGWSQEAIDKARMYELSTLLSSLAATRCPDLLKFVAPCVKRLCPLRLSQGGRQLRAWGRSYLFSADDAELVKVLVKSFKNGTPKVALGDGVLLEHQAVKDGVIQRTGGTYWLEEPEEEKVKPKKLVLYVDAEPEEVLSGEAKAVAILMDHPEWSDSRIAAEVPCHRSTLYTWPKYVAARKAMKMGRGKYERDSVMDDEVDLD